MPSSQLGKHVKGLPFKYVASTLGAAQIAQTSLFWLIKYLITLFVISLSKCVSKIAFPPGKTTKSYSSILTSSISFSANKQILLIVAFFESLFYTSLKRIDFEARINTINN